ncbi:MAG TPA: hypothetical protein VIG38_07170 [Hyphomicrobium sp.]|jgi:hypothetical protein
MVRLHPTRLMRSGEVALWHEGKIVWLGSVGSDVRDITFDAVSLSTDDSLRITASIGEGAITAETIRATLADWWG